MARRLSAKSAGEPGIKMPSTNWPRVAKPMRAIRSVRTLMKRDESKGITQPEFKTTLQRAGVGTRQQSPSVVRQTPETPPASGRGTTRVKTPSPTNGGGIRSPFRRGRGS